MKRRLRSGERGRRGEVQLDASTKQFARARERREKRRLTALATTPETEALVFDEAASPEQVTWKKEKRELEVGLGN